MEDILLTPEQELEQLRASVQQRALLDTATAALNEAGLDTAFAPYLTGGDISQTTKHVESFSKLFSIELQKQISSRLPNFAPKSLDIPNSKTIRRGIKRK